MVALFQRHVEAELAGDLNSTTAKMTDDPHLNHVPTMAGGVGRAGVQAFYGDHLVGKFFPPDVTMTNVSRTIGQDQLVDEIAISFTPYPTDRLAAAGRSGDRKARGDGRRGDCGI